MSTTTTFRSRNLTVPATVLEDFASRWKVAELAFFGSVLRDDFRLDSDVDVLVTFLPGVVYGMRDWQRMEDELVDILQRKVDLISRQAVEQSTNYIRRRNVLNSAKVIYET